MTELTASRRAGCGLPPRVRRPKKPCSVATGPRSGSLRSGGKRQTSCRSDWRRWRFHDAVQPGQLLMEAAAGREVVRRSPARYSPARTTQTVADRALHDLVLDGVKEGNEGGAVSRTT